jgi:hypothetical protein
MRQMRVITPAYPWINNLAMCRSIEGAALPPNGNHLQRIQMNQIELPVVEETVRTTEQQEFELSLSELDMVGGGSSAIVNT